MLLQEVHQTCLEVWVGEEVTVQTIPKDIAANRKGGEERGGVQLAGDSDRT